jgi:lipopolysaccharide/colanic/teichoic acid biosynthesis glycosyltransferase
MIAEAIPQTKEPSRRVHVPPQREPAVFALPQPAGWYANTKWIVDFVLALALLILSAPLILLGIVLVKLTSRGPAFYSQLRLGLAGRPFAIYKIRTMRHNCESTSGARWCSPGDSRVTWVGRFLRAMHVDELPQLWNILRGDMSLIGPRPERPEFAPQLELVLPLYRERLRVRPGLTGLAQVQLPPDTDITSVRRKLACDLSYVQHHGLWLDFRILAATLAHVVHVPGTLVRRIFRLPGGEQAQHAYQQLAVRAEASAFARRGHATARAG